MISNLYSTSGAIDWPEVTGHTYYPAGAVNSGGSQSAGLVSLVPIEIYGGRSFASLVIPAIAGATGNARLGIYADNNGRPGALIYDAGQIALAASIDNVLAFGQTLSGGRYWLAANFSAGNGGTLWKCGALTKMQNGGAGLSPVYCYTLASAYGALPASAAAAVAGTNQANAVAIGLRA